MKCSTGITSFKLLTILAFDQSINLMKTSLNRKIYSQAQMFLILISQVNRKAATTIFYLNLMHRHSLHSHNSKRTSQGLIPMKSKLVLSMLVQRQVDLQFLWTKSYKTIPKSTRYIRKYRMQFSRTPENMQIWYHLHNLLI